MRESPTVIPVHLFNTHGGAVCPVAVAEPGKVRLYACGPTVYKHAHIGNMRTYVFEDVLVRALRFAGYQVEHVMNITDVGHLQSDADAGEDKMSLAAIEERRSPWDIARFYEAEFFRHASMLNIRRPSVVCRATEHIDDMIRMISTLQQKGFAYQSGGNVYFDIARFPQYADFAHLKLDDTQSTERVEFDGLKRNQQDFALWFSQSKFPNQIMKWESPWGIGFPGWHIECSAMATRYLGDNIDIHCGGIDHIGVHHTNEIAQSECCLGHKWVNHWFHCGFLEIGDGKMSKSSGRVLTVDTLATDGYPPLAYRYLVLTSHYRGALTYSAEAMQGATNAYANLVRRIQGIRADAHGQAAVSASALTSVTAEEANAGAAASGEAFGKAFFDAIFNDLHTPTALASLWSVVKSDALSAAQKMGLIARFDEILGLDLLTDVAPKITAAQQAMIEERAGARAAKNWARADELRAILVAEGVDLMDGKV